MIQGAPKDIELSMEIILESAIDSAQISERIEGIFSIHPWWKSDFQEELERALASKFSTIAQAREVIQKYHRGEIMEVSTAFDRISMILQN